MDEQKVTQVLRSIFDKYGAENLRNGKIRETVVKSYIPDMLNKVEYRDENLVLTQAMRSDAICSLVTENVTGDDVKRAVDRLESEEHMRREDAEFVVKCIRSACGRNDFFEREQKEERKNAASTPTDHTAEEVKEESQDGRSLDKKIKITFIAAAVIVLFSFVFIFITNRKGYRYEVHDSYVEIVGAFAPFGLISGSVTEVEIPAEIEGKPVTKIGNEAFSGCRSLKSIKLPGSVTEIGWDAFENCSSLTSITLPEGVTKIGYGAFYDCINLKSIKLPGSVTEIGEHAFDGCSSLTNIILSEYIEDEMSEAFENAVENAFSNVNLIIIYIIHDSYAEVVGVNVNSIVEVEIPAEIMGKRVTQIGYGAFGGCSSLTSITLPESVTEIGDDAFYKCSSLTEMQIPYSVTRIGEEAFRDCVNLEWIAIPEHTEVSDSVFENPIIRYKIHDSYVEIISANVNSITEVEIPAEIVGKHVIKIGNEAFSDCSSLISVTLPEGVTEIGKEAFLDCSSLTSITLPESVTEIGATAFCGCSSLTSITLPEGVTKISIEAFCGCSSLTNIILPESVTEIGDYAFGVCMNLTSVTLPESVTEIGDYAFGTCSSLTSIILPESVTEIGDYAFECCSSLTEMQIPYSVTRIGDRAFYDCENLARIAIPEHTEVSDTAFENSNPEIRIYVRESELE